MHFDIHGMPVFLMAAGEGGSDDPQTAQEFFEAKLKTVEVEARRAQVEKEIAASLGDQLEAARKQLETETIRLKNLETLLDNQEEFNQKLLESGGSVDKIVKGFGLTEKQAKKLNQAYDGSADSLEKMKDILVDMRKDLEISTKFANQLDTGFATLAKNMGISANATKGMFGGFAKGLSTLFSGDVMKNFQSLGAGIFGLFSPLNIVSSTLEKAVGLFIEMDKAAVAMRISTGKSLTNMHDQINDISASTAKFGIKLDEVTKALTQINTEITGGGLESFKLSLAESATLMTKFGVQSATTAKNQQLLLKTFKGISATGVNKILEDIAVSADTVGKTATAMAADFSGAMEYLVVDGMRAVEIFKQLEIQAAETGLAVTDFTNLGKKFDKFSEGAKTAATFNAVLGTSMSSIALMSMDTAQRMEVMRNEINSATGGFDNMTRAQRLFAASALGMSEAKTAQFLKADTAEMKKREAAMKAQRNIQQKLNDAMDQLLPIMERVSMAFEQFVRENPELIDRVANSMLALVKAGTYLVANLKTIVTVSTSLFFLYKLGAALITHLTRARLLHDLGVVKSARIAQTDKAIKAGLIGVENAQTAAINANTLARNRNLKSMGKMALALGLLFTMYHMTGSPMLYMMPLVMAGFILIMSFALEKMSGQGIIAALALAIFAGAIALVFYGMAAFTESLTSFFNTLIGSIDMIPVLAVTMFGLGAAFMFLGTAAMMSSIGIFMGLAGLTAMLAIFKLTGTSMKDMFGAGDEIFKIGSGIEKFGSGLDAIKSSIAAIKQSMGDDGLLAATLQGDKSSVVMGKNVAVAKLFKNSTLTVDVKMPEISMPETTVKVYIGNEELKDIIRKEIRRNA